MLSLFALMVVVLWLATFFSSSPYERFCQIDIFPHRMFFLLLSKCLHFLHQRISKRQKASPSIGSLMAASFLLYIYAPLVVWALFPHRLKKRERDLWGSTCDWSISIFLFWFLLMFCYQGGTDLRAAFQYINKIASSGFSELLNCHWESYKWMALFSGGWRDAWKQQNLSVCTTVANCTCFFFS